MTEYLSLKNFAKHQHYKDRRPPWIKLHAAILEDYEFSCLQDASKAHLLLIGLLASKLNNRIPNDAAWIARQIGASTTVDIQVLVASGFLIVMQDASAVISPRKQSALVETETEREAKTETETSPASARVRGRLETDDRAAFDVLLSRVPEPTTWAAECEAMLDGMPGHQRATPGLLGKAIRDFTGNGKLQSPNLRQFRRYVQGAADEALPKTNGHARARSMTGTAQALCQDLRAKRNPMFPGSVPPVWKDGLPEGTIDAVRPFLSRIYADDPKGEGTLVAQLARALEEATA